MPSARGKVPERFAGSLRSRRALLQDGPYQRGDFRVSKGAEQSAQANSSDGLPRAVLRPPRHERPGGPHPAKRHQRKADLRRRKEGADLYAGLRPGKDGQEKGSHRAVRIDLRNGHWLQGRRGEGGRSLFGKLNFALAVDRHNSAGFVASQLANQPRSRRDSQRVDFILLLRDGWWKLMIPKVRSQISDSRCVCRTRLVLERPLFFRCFDGAQVAGNSIQRTWSAGDAAR